MAKILEQGHAAPDFTLPANNEAKISLKNYAGKNLVLYFYPKDDTSGCTLEAQNFNALREDFLKANTVIVGVSPDAVASHSKFAKKYDLQFSLASDEAKTMLEAYGVWVEKSMYGRKYMGVERTTVLIDAKGMVAQIWNKVKVPGHADAVLAAAKAL
jgi:thioredoxin-dependent peroxiredoxin